MNKFVNKRMSVIAYADGVTIWMYVDRNISVDEMEQEGFFNPVKDLMAIGDPIYLIAQDTVKHMWIKTVNPVSLEDMGE